MSKEEKIIMFESDEAATYRTNIEGWVSSKGHFYGKDERTARYDGSTHHKCECGNVTEQYYTRCESCRIKSANEAYLKLSYKEWDTQEPICLYNDDHYFFDEESLIEYLYDNELNGSDVQLVLCQPVHYQPIDEETIAGDAYEEWEPSKELSEKINQFNAFLETLPPHSWMPGKIRTSYEYTYKPE